MVLLSANSETNIKNNKFDTTEFIKRVKNLMQKYQY